jgi:hypothetical protein
MAPMQCVMEHAQGYVARHALPAAAISGCEDRSLYAGRIFDVAVDLRPDLLCVEGICPLERGGPPILSDDNHLSDEGARLLIIRPLADEIMRTVTRVLSFGMTYQR